MLGQNEGMNITDNELQKHYRLLLGIDRPWQVAEVKLELAEKRVKICLVWQEGQKAPCPVCGRECTLYDLAPERTWRHLDTMQFETILRARTPRVECPTDGVKTIVVPWAEPGGRFSRLFERFAIDVMLCARSVKQAAGLMGLSWDEVDHILRRAVERGLSRREMEGLSHVGIDEKSFRSGQSYISLLTDLKKSRVLDVVEGRTQEAAEALWDTLSAEQRGQIEAVAVDMWEPFLNASRAKAPQAEIDSTLRATTPPQLRTSLTRSGRFNPLVVRPLVYHINHHTHKKSSDRHKLGSAQHRSQKHGTAPSELRSRGKADGQHPNHLPHHHNEYADARCRQ